MSCAAKLPEGWRTGMCALNGRNLAASVRARLLNRARETRQDFSLILTRYAIERLLYRLSISPHADRFLLKGGLLFDLWFDVPHRPTREPTSSVLARPSCRTLKLSSGMSAAWIPKTG